MELALRAAVILIAAWLAAAALKRAAAATRHLVWHWAMIAVLAAPLLQPLMPSIEVPKVPGVPDVLGVPGLLGAPERRPRELSQSMGGVPGATASSSTSNATPARTLSTLGSLGTRIWSAGLLATATWFALGWLSAAVTARRATRAPATWQIEANALRERMRIAADVEIRMVAANVSPLAMGFWRSTILLPSAANEWDGERRRAVLVHELAHIRRHDCRVHAFAQAACALYWFNPLIWMAFRRLRLERERACDDEVLAQGAQPSSYARHLLEIARTLQPAFRPSAAIAMARPSELEGRLLAVLAVRGARVPARGTRWAIALTLSAATVGALGITSAETRTPKEQSLHAATVPLPFKVPLDEPTRQARVAAKKARDQASHALASSTDPHARQRAALDLASSAQADTIPSLEAALDDESQDVREKAALGLGLQASPDVIPALLRALQDPDAQVREKAAIGLAMRRDPRVVDALIPALSDPYSQVREKAALALGTSGDLRAVPVLDRALQDPDPQVREKAITGLMLLRDGVSQLATGDSVRDGLRGVVGAFVRLTR